MLIGNYNITFINVKNKTKSRIYRKLLVDGDVREAIRHRNVEFSLSKSCKVVNHYFCEYDNKYKQQYEVPTITFYSL